jgi:hypothetical protein
VLGTRFVQAALAVAQSRSSQVQASSFRAPVLSIWEAAEANRTLEVDLEERL